MLWGDTDSVKQFDYTLYQPNFSVQKTGGEATIDQPPESQMGSPRGSAMLLLATTIMIVMVYVRHQTCPHHCSCVELTPLES